MHRYGDLRVLPHEPRVDDHNLLDRIRQVEGPLYGSARGGLIDANSNKPLLQKYAEYRANYQSLLDSGDKDDRECGEERLSRQAATGIVIYGDGGWNRYFVRGDGTVVFSRSHAASGSIGKALDAGFSVE